MRRPRTTGGCGVTTPSVQYIPILSGSPEADPSALALASVDISASLFQGILTTFGSRSHGLVDSTEVITSLIASIVVPMTPTDEA